MLWKCKSKLRSSAFFFCWWLGNLIRNIGTQGVQELFLGELEAPGVSNTQWTLNSYDKVNPTSLFGYDVLVDVVAVVCLSSLLYYLQLVKFQFFSI